MSQPVAEVGAYKNMTASGAVTTGPCQLIGFYVNNTTAGTMVLTDGGASGTILLKMNIPANTNNPFANIIPGNGIRFNTSIYVTLPASAAITIFCG